MEQMKQLISLFILCGLLTFTACDRFKKLSGWERDSVVIDDLIRYSDTLSTQVKKSVIEGQEFPEYNISVKVVLTGKDSIDEVICKAVFGHSGEPRLLLQNMVDSLEREFTQELTEFYSPGEDDDDTMSYEYTATCLPSNYAKPNTAHPALSYEYALETYLGGAHGSYEVQYLNFASDDGHRIRLAEVYEGDPCTAMMEKLLKDNGCKTKEELMEKTDILMTGDLYPTENFLIVGDSLLFRFNAYEIAPYSSGAVEVMVPCNR